MRKIHYTAILFILVIPALIFGQVHFPGQVDITGSEEIVFDYSSDACELEDIPDAPARAFRDADGKIQLIASHYISYRMIGDDFNSLVKDTTVIFNSDDDPDPSHYNNKEWIRGIYTTDGKTIHAIIHNEYLPFGAGSYETDYFNSLTYAVSTDTGRSYTQAAAPGHFLATIPYQYTTGHPMGIFNGSNIIYNPNDGYYYRMVHLEQHKLQDWGAGVIRTQTLDDPDSWRGWDGEGFNVHFVDPYNEDVDNPANYILEPVSRDNIGKMSDCLVYSTYLERYIVVGPHVKYDAYRGEDVHGFYYSMSEDLINWSAPILIRETPEYWTVGGEWYPTLIDHSDTTRNFEHIGQDAYLYFTRWNSGSFDRDLIRLPIRFNKNLVTFFTVNSPGDGEGRSVGDGTGYTGYTNSIGDPEVTLRSALHEVLASPDPDYVFTVNFDIPGDGPHVINIGGFLPEPDRPLIIDGYSQPGASPNTNALNEGNNAVIKIELDGSGSGGAAGFNLYGGNTIIKGLAIHSFGGGILINDAGNCKIQGCYIGADASGAAQGDGIGIEIYNSSNNIIGGTDPADFNVITGEIIINEGCEYNEIRGNYIGLDASGANTVAAGGISIRNAANNIIDSNVSSGTYRGLEIQGLQSQNNTVTNNFFGTDMTGVNPMSSGLIAIYLSAGASNNLIGTPDNGNVIGSWQYRGIVLDSVFSNKVQGNLIGTDKDATADLGNENEAIHLINSAADNLIGGTAAGEGNIIANNNGIAVRVGAESADNLAGAGNGILGNLIYFNKYGIDIDPSGVNENDVLDTDTGPNNLQNSPELSVVDIGTNDTHIEGQLKSEVGKSYRIEFFANDALDQNGLGQGQEFIGYQDVTTGSDGTAAIDVHFAVEITPGYYITATATDPDNNTSEFSNPVRATSTIYFPDIDVSPTNLTFSVNPTQMLDDNITIENSGNLSLNWSATTTAFWIRLDQESGSLAAGSSTLLNVTVNPDGMQAGTHTDVVTITSTDPDEATIEITVSMTINGYAEAVLAPDTLEVTVAPDSSGTDTLYVSNSGTTLLEYYLHTSNDYVSVNPTWGTVPAGGTDTVIVTVNADTLDYGYYAESVRVDPISDQPSFTIPLNVNVAIPGPSLSCSRESISAVLELNSITTYDVILSNPGTELLTWSAFCNDPWVIPNPDTSAILPGETDTIVVTLDVTGMALGPVATNLWIYSNDPANNPLGIPVSVEIVEPGARMSIEPVSFDITVKAHKIYRDSIRITNDGTEVLHWSGLPAEDWFTISPDTGDVAPNSTVAIALTVDAKDKAEQTYSESIGFISNAIDNSDIVLPLTINVMTEPEITVIPDSIHVELQRGQNGTTSFVIRNDGSANLENLNVGNSFESNWLNPDPRNPDALAPGDSVLITVAITGNVLDVGDHPGLCFVNSNDPDEPVVEVPILVTITEELLPPELVITDPPDYAVFDTNIVAVEYIVNNFTVATPPAGDGYVRFQRNGYPVRSRYGVNPLVFENLAEGDHMLRIWLVDNNGDYLDPMVADTLFFTVHIPAPEIVVTPETLTYSVLAGSAFQDTITVYNIGDADLRWALSNQTTWLNYNLAAGITAASDSTELILTIDTAPLSGTYYVDTLSFFSNDPEMPSLRIPVELDLVPNLGIDVAQFIPDKYMLFRNYPNPFNPTTLIQYYLPEESLVEIIVFDFLGNEVKTLVNDKQAGRFHRIQWDGTNDHGVSMPSGMYFFRMVAKSPQKQYVKTRKMILLH